jgi:hypothetical protein
MPSTIDDEYPDPDYDDLYSSNPNLPNGANGRQEMDKTSRPDETPAFLKSSASQAFSPRLSDYFRRLHLMAAATMQLVLVFLPLCF